MSLVYSKCSRWLAPNLSESDVYGRARSGPLVKGERPCTGALKWGRAQDVTNTEVLTR